MPIDHLPGITLKVLADVPMHGSHCEYIRSGCSSMIRMRDGAAVRRMVRRGDGILPLALVLFYDGYGSVFGGGSVVSVNK